MFLIDIRRLNKCVIKLFQEICNKADDNYSHALEFVPECYKTQKMCGKAVNIYPSMIKICS